MTSFKDMPPHSRVWIYQSDREFTFSEVEMIERKSEKFVEQWTSHERLMSACIELFHNRFIVVCVDEKTAPASGCGIDKSVKFIQQLEKDFSVSLLDRINVAYRKNLTPTLSKGEEEIFTCDVSELKNSGATTVFNNLVSTKEELEKNWEVLLEKSWHKQFLT